MFTNPVIPTGALHWAHPWVFLLLILIPLPFIGALWLQHRRGGVRYPNVFTARILLKDPRQNLHYVVGLLRMAALACLVVALARPQGEQRRVDQEIEGVDIMVALDLSESMRATDIRPDRLRVAKRVLEQFIRARATDRIGLAVFSGASFTLVPLTTDHDALIESLQDLNPGAIGIDGTAIGDGVLSALSRLLDDGGSASPAKNRIVILATDGVNNRGSGPMQAAYAAAEKGVRLYVIGLGSLERVPRLEINYAGKPAPMLDVYGNPVYWDRLDESALRRMAEIGRGRYFRAASRSEFEAVVEAIDQLEKHKINFKHSVTYAELFHWPLLLALGLLAFERLLARTRFRVLV